MAENDFFSREEVLGGLPARRASTTLFAIESRTGFLVGRARRATARFVSEKSVEARERAFLEAFSMGREPPLQPTIQDLERYALDCVALIPNESTVRAAIAQALSKKYLFMSQNIPVLREILGLDSVEVEVAFQNQYGQPLQSIYANDLTVREKVRWEWSKFTQRLENIPPFWTAFSLTFTETVGATILALPIALAGIGALAGMVILLVLGLVSILTITGIVEAITRNGNLRFGIGYLGRLVNDYLGSMGTFTLSIMLLLLNVLVSIVFYIGISSTLEASTGISSIVWTILLFAFVLYILHRESIDATVASSLLVGAISIGLLIIMMLLALPHLRVDNLLYVHSPLINQEFDPAILKLVFGIVLAAYFGHTSAANAAKVVLRRDPSGRALLWGNIAAMGCVVVLYCAWVAFMGAAISPAVLLSTTGTVLKPLADVAGNAIYVFGAIYVVLSMGISILHFSLGSFNQVQEWLPSIPSEVDTLKPKLGALPKSLYGLITTKRRRFWLGVTPAIICFVVAFYALFTGRASFSGLVNLVGVIFVPVLGGVFPILLLAASRRKGDYLPGVVVQFLGHPVVMGGIYFLYLGSLVLHGLFILHDPLEQILTLLASVVIVVMTIAALRGGAFVGQAVFEIRQDSTVHDQGVFNVINAGQPLTTVVTLNYGHEDEHFHASTGDLAAFRSLQSVVIELPASIAKELKIWVHQLNMEGISEPISAIITVYSADKVQTYDLIQSGGQILLPLNHAQCRIEIRFPEHTPQLLLNDVIDLSKLF